MLKRGQVTIFVVVMLVIIIVLALFYSLFSSFRISAQQDDFAKNVKDYTDECVRITLENGIKSAALLGGMSDAGKVTDLNQNLATLTLQKSSKIMAEEYIASYIKEHLNDCLVDYQLFNGMNIAVGAIERADVGINNDDISAIVEMPVQVQTRSMTRTFSVFRVSTGSGLKELVGTERTILDSEEIDMTFLGRLGSNVSVLG